MPDLNGNTVASRKFYLLAFLATLVVTLFAAKYVAHYGVRALIWSTSGVALWLLLRAGLPCWPFLMAGTLAGNLLSGRNLDMALIATLANTVAPLLAYLVIRRAQRFVPTLPSLADYKVLGGASVICALAAATIGAGGGTLWGVFLPPSFGEQWWAWFLRNFFSCLVITSFLLVWQHPPKGWFSSARRVETTAFFLTLAVIGQIVFFGEIYHLDTDHLGPAAFFVMLFWGITRYQKHGAFLVILLGTGHAILAHALGVSHFNHAETNWDSQQLWYTLLTLCVFGQLLAIAHDEQKESRQHLDHREKLLRAILDSLSSHIAVINARGDILATNAAWKAFARSNGAPEFAKDDIDKNYLEAVDPETAQAIQHVLSGGRQEYVSIYPCHSPDQKRWFRMAAIPLPASTEGGAVITHEDITERQIDEHNLLKQILDAASDASLLVDKAGEIRHANHAASLMFGYTKEEFAALPSVDFLVPEHIRHRHAGHRSAYFAAPVSRAMAGRKELFATNRWGIQFPVEISLSPITLYGEQYAITSISDKTWQHAIEKSLRASEARFRGVIELSSSPLMLRDKHDHIFYLNPAFLDLFGYTTEDIPTIEDWRRLAYPDPAYRAWATEIWEERYNAEHDVLSTPLEMRLQTKSGRMVTALVTGALLDGSREGTIALAFVDMTERTELQANLSELNRTLETRVEERTRDLQLAREQAEEASRQKAQFLANMSHEIRTPIHAILGFTHLALEQGPHAQPLQHLAKIESAGQLLLGVVNDILDFSKIEAGKMSLDPHPFLLHLAFERIRTLTSQMAAQKKLAIDIQLSSELPACIFADRLRLEQVLMNFVSNAIKFTAKGRVTVSAATLEREASAWLRVTVQDTGIGIPHDVQARIFDAFEQADGTTTRRFGGTGLGLAINRALISLMGGTLGCESTPGQGATFWFEIPLRIADTQLAEGNAPSQASLEGMRILLVDDNEINLEVATEMLHARGAQISTAHNGHEALTALETAPFDLVLMDIQMPVMDGLEATRQLRRHPALSELPVIAMTANASRESQQECQAAGMNGFVAKPFTANDLLAALEDIHTPRAPQTDALAGDAATAANKPPTIMDWGALEKAAGNDITRQEKYARLFLSTTIQELATLRQALAEARIDDASRIGHKMKSSAKWVGAIAFSQICIEIEALRQSPDIEHAKQLLGEAETAFASARDAIEEHFPDAKAK